MKRTAAVLKVLFILAVLSLSPIMASYWVKGYVERCLKIEIQGKFEPLLFQTAFRLQDGSFDWKNRVKLNSGDLSVRYDLKELLFHRKLRLFVEGSNLDVGLTEGWIKEYQGDSIIIDSADIDMSLDQEGINEIHFLDVNSSYMTFRIQASDPSQTVSRGLS